jgi:hypothetical protein
MPRDAVVRVFTGVSLVANLVWRIGNQSIRVVIKFSNKSLVVRITCCVASTIISLFANTSAFLRSARLELVFLDLRLRYLSAFRGTKIQISATRLASLTVLPDLTGDSVRLEVSSLLLRRRFLSVIGRTEIIKSAT